MGYEIPSEIGVEHVKMIGRDWASIIYTGLHKFTQVHTVHTVYTDLCTGCLDVYTNPIRYLQLYSDQSPAESYEPVAVKTVLSLARPASYTGQAASRLVFLV